MVKCKDCGFDSEEDSLFAEGAPCGVDGCHTYTCCTETWIEHCKKTHPHYKSILGDT